MGGFSVTEVTQPSESFEDHRGDGPEEDVDDQGDNETAGGSDMVGAKTDDGRNSETGDFEKMKAAKDIAKDCLPPAGGVNRDEDHLGEYQ